jgi:hypothetical protein
MAAKKVQVRVNASHDGLRAGRVYVLEETADLKARAEAGRLTILGPAPRGSKPGDKVEPDGE